jgi:hypothetical protein
MTPSHLRWRREERKEETTVPPRYHGSKFRYSIFSEPGRRVYFPTACVCCPESQTFLEGLDTPSQAMRQKH